MSNPQHISRLPAWLGRNAFRLLALLPPAALAWFIWRDAVNVPYWDEWDGDMVGVFINSGHGRLTFGDLWAQHNESRLVLPRIFFLLLGRLTHWNLLAEMAVTFLLLCGIGLALFWLGRMTFPGRPAAHRPVFLLCSLMLFSPAQSQALLWGMELILYVPLLCILAALLAHRTRPDDRKTYLFAAALATVSTWTFVNGMLVWVVLFPVFFLADGWTGLCRRKSPALAWLAAAFANGLVYFYHFEFASSNGFWRKLWTDPWPAAHYFFAFLGGSLANVGRSVISVDHSSCLLVATVIGAVLFLSFILCLLGLFRLRNQTALMTRAWPWVAVGGYGILSAAMATAGRSLVFGVEQSLSPRYAIFGISLMLALAHLVPLLARHPSPALSPVSSPERSSAQNPALALSVLGLVMAGFFLLIWPSQALDMEITRLERLQAKSCLDFINVIPWRPAMTEFLSPLYPQLKQSALELEKLGFLDRPLLDSNRLAALQTLDLPASQVCGGIEQDRPLPGARVELSGWAVSPFHPGPADCILLTYQTAGAGPVVFDLLWHRVVRRDLVARFHDPDFLEAGWLIVTDLSHAPMGRLKLQAWAYDVERRAVAPLQNPIEVDNE